MLRDVKQLLSELDPPIEPLPERCIWTHELIDELEVMAKRLLSYDDACVCLEYLQSYGINPQNTCATDAADLCLDAINDRVILTSPKDSEMSDNGTNGKKARKAKETRDRYVSTTHADYVVLGSVAMVANHGRPTDPWGNVMISELEAKAAKKAAREAFKAANPGKVQEIGVYAGLSDEEKKILRGQRKVEKAKAIEAQQLQMRFELEQSIRAQILAEQAQR